MQMAEEMKENKRHTNPDARICAHKHGRYSCESSTISGEQSVSFTREPESKSLSWHSKKYKGVSIKQECSINQRKHIQVSSTSAISSCGCGTPSSLLLGKTASQWCNPSTVALVQRLPVATPACPARLGKGMLLWPKEAKAKLDSTSVF